MQACSQKTTQESLLFFHIHLHQFPLLIFILSFDEYLKGRTDGFVIRMVAVNVPVLENCQLLWFGTVEEDAIAP